MEAYPAVQSSAQSGPQTAVDGGVFNVNCTSSSDFVVGRQTNFHAPVTIINCPSPYPDETPESIVIRDQLWSRDTTKALESGAVKTGDKYLKSIAFYLLIVGIDGSIGRYRYMQVCGIPI